MEFIEIVKVKLATCFYYPNQTHVFSVQRLRVIFLGVFTILSQLLFVCLDADNMSDFVIAALIIESVTGTVISFVDTSLKTTKIFSTIDYGG